MSHCHRYPHVLVKFAVSTVFGANLLDENIKNDLQNTKIENAGHLCISSVHYHTKYSNGHNFPFNFFNTFPSSLVSSFIGSLGLAILCDSTVPITTIKYTNGDMYTGETISGVRQGVGVMRYYNNSVYDGEWREDKRNGVGTLTTPDSSLSVSVLGNVNIYYTSSDNQTMLSSVSNTILSGVVSAGQYTPINLNSDILRINFKSGTTYTGQFTNDQFHGTGKLTRTSDKTMIYNGEWRDSEPYGYAVAKNPRSDLKLGVGQFYMGSYDGHGTAVLPNGTVYAGEFKRGSPQGYGIIRDAKGENSYNGLWNKGHFEGRGVGTIKGVGIYSGNYLKSKEHGHGKMVYENHCVYEGQWRDGAMCGQGVMKYPNNMEYSGEWRGNLKSGYGVMRYPGGEVYSGE
jgi:hypothetical protein